MLAVTRGHGEFRGQFRGALDGGNIWWVAPTYQTIVDSNIWDDLKKALQGCWVEKHETKKQIKLPGGGSITIRSADDKDKSLRGAGLDGVFIDEAAFLSVEAWRKGLRPSLADKQGWAILATTPNGKNWIYDQFKKSRAEAGWQKWQMPSACNPLVTADELESLKHDMGPRAYAQEHEAQFSEIEGALWPSSYFDDHIWTTNFPVGYEMSAMAIDPSMGKTDRSDFSAIVFLGLSQGALYCECSIARRTPLDLVKDAIRLHSKWKPDYIGIEANGFQEVLKPMFDLVCERDQIVPLPIVSIHNTTKKEIRIQKLDPYLANSQLRFREDDADALEMIEQLIMFPNSAYHDDGPDALEMAIRMLISASAALERASDNYDECYA